MPNFSYKGRNQGGALVSGEIQAMSAGEAASELFGRNITPIDITELQAKVAREAKQKAARPAGTRKQGDTGAQSGKAGYVPKNPGFFGGGKIAITDLMIFTRQMYSLSKAGMPLDRALRGLEASIANPQMKRVLRDVLKNLEKGTSLSDAFGRHPRVFNQLYLSLVNVGENTGRLDLAFEQIGRYLALDRDTAKQIKSATRYPTFVLIAIGVAMSVLMLFVIPVFTETFAQLNAELPWQTVLIISTSNFFVQYWPYMLGTLVIGFVLFRRWIGTPLGRRMWDRRKLTFPLVGSILERIALSRFARTFAMMMKAGVPIVQALGVIGRAVGNSWVGMHVSRMSDRIAKGESLYQSAVKTRMFSPLVLQMIAVGEEGGNVDELMEEVADFYDAEIEYDLKRLSSAIEPILIVFIAGIVLVLALGVFLPIWDLSRAAG